MIRDRWLDVDFLRLARPRTPPATLSAGPTPFLPTVCRGTATFLRAIGPEPWKAAYVQPSRRPKDGRYGENPNRMQHYYQYQVVLKTRAGKHPRALLGQPARWGFDLKKTTSASSRTTGENPTLGAWGLGWEVAQRHGGDAVHHFQQVGGIDCKPATGEITYGLERLAMYLQAGNVFDPGVDRTVLKYGDVYHQNEVEQSTYNFEHSDVDLPCSPPSAPMRTQAKHLMGSNLRCRPRAGAQGGAHTLQPARCARCHLGDRARRLHRPHPQPGRAPWRKATSIPAPGRDGSARWRRRPPTNGGTSREKKAATMSRKPAGGTARRRTAAQGTEKTR